MTELHPNFGEYLRELLDAIIKIASSTLPSADTPRDELEELLETVEDSYRSFLFSKNLSKFYEDSQSQEYNASLGSYIYSELVALDDACKIRFDSLQSDSEKWNKLSDKSEELLRTLENTN